MAQNLLVEIVSPDGAVFRGEALSFRAPGTEGAFEVLRGHAPLLAAVGVGPVVVVTPEGQHVSFAVSGGFVEVIDNHVVLLAETAEAGSAIDVERARAAEEKARERIAAAVSPAERAEAQAALDRARNRARAAIGQVERA